MRLLLLGGIGEARTLAAELHRLGHAVIYSVAGLTRLPELPCEVISGGFSRPGVSGIAGLSEFIRLRGIDLLLDVTHPYAAQISAHAIAAARLGKVPCWQLYRPGWTAAVKGQHCLFGSLSELLPRLAHRQRPFFTIGHSLLACARQRPPHQHWFVRTLATADDLPGLTCLDQRGPFTLAAERKLMQELQVDALVTRDSGGDSVVAKLFAAHELGIPVYIQRRPRFERADRLFTDRRQLLSALPPPDP